MRLEGTKTWLKPITYNDIELLRKWRNTFSQDFFSSEQITKEQQRQWYEKYQDQAGRDYMWIITKKDNNEPVGTIALYQISLPDRTAHIGRILVLPEFRGIGYAEEAVNIVSEIAFNQMRLYKLILETYLDNSGAIALYHKCGFTSLNRPVMVMEKKNPTNNWKKPMKLVSYDGEDYESTASNIVS